MKSIVILLHSSIQTSRPELFEQCYEIRTSLVNMSEQNFVKKHLEALISAQRNSNERKCLEILDILENHFDGTLSLAEISEFL